MVRGRVDDTDAEGAEGADTAVRALASCVSKRCLHRQSDKL